MQWTQEIVSSAPSDVVVENVIELLKRMGFREYERVSSRKDWGIDIVAIRDDPIAGTEKVVIAVHRRGLASSKDVNVFAGLVERYKADKGILVSPVGFTKDAKVLISREYRGRVIPWDGAKLASLFNNYSIEPPEFPPAEEREAKEEEKLKRFELDAPLLRDFSREDVMRKVASFVSAKYPIKPDEIKLESLSLQLSTAYIFSWSLEEEGKVERDKAVVFSKERVVLRASTDESLSIPVKRALLNDGSVIEATERTIEVPISPSEAVFVLKETAAREFGVPEGKVRVHERKKVYIPVRTELEVSVGHNRGKSTVELESGKVDFGIEPLPDDYFRERMTRLIADQTGEEPVEMNLTRDGWKVKVSGRTERFSFEAVFNGYTGKAMSFEALLSDEAVEELIKTAYPGGKTLSLEKGKKVAVADILLEDGIAVMQIDLTTGRYKEVRRLPSPERAFESAKRVIEDNFPVGMLELSSYSVVEHKYLELTMESRDGRATVKIDGISGDVLDYSAEITPERARELILERNPGLKVEVEEGDEEYVISAENERQVIRFKVSRDGKIIEETDRFLRKDVAEKLALEAARKIDEEAVLKGVALEKDWIAEFAGREKTGKLVLKRDTGEVLRKDVQFTEMAIKDAYLDHVRKAYGEENPSIERMTLYGEKGYVHIKVSGKETLYYARIDLRTGKIVSEDTAPAKGLTAKLKQFQLESKYK